MSKVQSLESGSGQDDGVVLAFVELAQASLDIAAQLADLQVRPRQQQLALAAQAGGANACAGLEFIQRARLRRQESIARIGAFKHGSDGHALGQDRRHVLHGMHGQFGVALHHRDLKLLDEQALAADSRQRSIEDAIALGDHGNQAHRQARMGRLQAGTDMLGLPEREAAASGRNADFAGHWRILPCPPVTPEAAKHAARG